MSNRMKLTVLFSSGESLDFERRPGESVSIGSGPGADVGISRDDTVDPIHCHLDPAGDSVELRDASEYGTFVGGRRVSTITLRSGSPILVGRTTLRVIYETLTPPVTPTPDPLPATPSGPSPSRPRRPRPIGRGPRPFYVELYQEHLEEAAFLLEQRAVLLVDDSLTWLDLEPFEARIEAHVDALCVGEALATQVAIEMVDDGDPWVRGVAFRTFCRSDAWDLIEAGLNHADLEDEIARRAVIEALTDEIPHHRLGSLAAVASQSSAWWTVEAALRVLSVHASDAAARVAPARLTHESPEVRAAAASALARGGNPHGRRALTPLLADESSLVRREVMAALVADGDPRALEACRNAAPTNAWAVELLSIGGSAADVLGLRAGEDAGDEWPSARGRALGVVGTREAVDVLLADLESGDIPAAASLHLITGAELFEEVFVEDEIDEDALSSEEKERLAAGEKPTRPDGEPYGEWIVRPAQDPDVWRAWIADTGGIPADGRRYRLGRPLTPEVAVSALATSTHSFALRTLTTQELSIRYGAPVCLDTTMPVHVQRRHLEELAAWAVSASSRGES